MKELRWSWILRLWVAVAGTVFVGRVAWELSLSLVDEVYGKELLAGILGISAIIFFATRVLRERT